MKNIGKLKLGVLSKFFIKYMVSSFLEHWAFLTPRAEFYRSLTPLLPWVTETEFLPENIKRTSDENRNNINNNQGNINWSNTKFSELTS